MQRQFHGLLFPSLRELGKPHSGDFYPNPTFQGIQNKPSERAFSQLPRFPPPVILNLPRVVNYGRGNGADASPTETETEAHLARFILKNHQEKRNRIGSATITPQQFIRQTYDVPGFMSCNA